MKKLSYLIMFMFSFCDPVYAGTLAINLKKPIDSHEYSFTLNPLPKAIENYHVELNYTYGETKDVTTEDKGSFIAGYDYSISDRWGIWAFDDFSYNEVKNTRDNNLGFGPKVYLLKGDHELSFGTGVLYDYDYINDESFSRLSHRIEYSYFDYGNVRYEYQPEIGNDSDFKESWRADVVLPGTNKTGKVYCLKKRRTVGTIEDECGLAYLINY